MSDRNCSYAKNELASYSFWQSSGLPLPKTKVDYSRFVHAQGFNRQKQTPTSFFVHSKGINMEPNSYITIFNSG